jgi:hypothetical protein
MRESVMKTCMFMILAEARWPDSLDTAVTLAFLGSVLFVAVLGYVFMFLDYRAYLRSLGRALIIVINYLPHVPEWAKMETPRCLAALGLKMPCNQQELLQAYRERVKDLHPDRGGDKRCFLALQSNFEQAAAFLENCEQPTT